MPSPSSSSRLEGLLRRLLRACPLDEWEAGKVVGDLGEDAIADMRLSEDRLSLVLSLPLTLSRFASALEARLRATLEPHLEGRTLALVLTSNKKATDATGEGASSAVRPQPRRQNGMAGVKIVLGVASGKGGVGKSTLAVNLAIALAQTRHKGGEGGKGGEGDEGGEGDDERTWRVGLLDADLYGPSLVPMLALDKPPRRNAEGLLIPEQRFGIQTLSMGSMLDKKQALIWRGPLIARALKQMLDGSAWGELDLLILDLPPGTGDLPLSLAQSAHLDCALLVTTPQQVALYEVQKSLAMFVTLRVGVVGIVENMSVFLCPQCGHESHIFGQSGAKDWACQNNLPLLGRLPLSQALQESADNATPLMISSHDRTETQAQKDDRKALCVLQEARSLQAEEIRTTLRSIARSVAESVARLTIVSPASPTPTPPPPTPTPPPPTPPPSHSPPLTEAS